jgi:hypothetical protein
MTGLTTIAPLVPDGAINGARFRADVEQVLAPCPWPGETVLSDNLGSHKVRGVREATEAKALPRTVARRTLDSPWGGIGTALSAFSPDECRNDIANCGFSHQ